MIRHRAELPLGFAVEFRFAPPAIITVDFTPAPRAIRNKQARQQFLAAYAHARSEFFTMVATTIGAGIAVVDLGRARVEGITISKPATRQ